MEPVVVDVAAHRAALDRHYAAYPALRPSEEAVRRALAELDGGDR